MAKTPGIKMAEAQRRFALMTKVVREHGVSIMPSIRKDRERRAMERIEK